MSYDHEAAARVVQAHGVERAPQPQDDIAPALAARRAMIELAEETTKFGLLRVQLLDARARQAIQDAELLFAQALIDDQLRRLTAPTVMLADELGGMTSARIGRAQDDLRTTVRSERAEPKTQRL